MECPQCKGKKLVHDYVRGELICANCGFVLEDRPLDRGPDWYAAEADEKRHTGPPVSESVHDRGISSRVGRRNRDALGRPLTPEQAAKFGRLRRWDKRAHATNSERTLTRAFQEQARVCHDLGLPKLVREEAALLFRRAEKERLLRSRSIETMAAAAIYFVCKKLGLRRDLSELAREGGVGLRDLRRAYILLCKKFCASLSPIETMYYVNDAIERLGLERIRIGVLKLLERRGTVSKKEAQKAVAAAIYRACRENGVEATQARIAKVVGLSRISISKFVRRAACEGFNVNAPKNGA